MRFSFGLPVAGIITIGLFLLMRYLILPMDVIEVKPEETAKIDITRPERDETTPDDRPKKPDRPTLPEAPPIPPVMQIVTNVDPDSDTSRIKPTLTTFNPKDFQPPRDRSAIPLVQVPPNYPPREISRGTEGWVLIEFNITPFGAVVDPIVIDADPANVFNSAALRAIQRWKYKPKIVDSKPVAQYGKEQLITFEIEE